MMLSGAKTRWQTLVQRITRWTSPEGALYLNQPGRVRAIAIAWTAASVAFFSAAAATLVTTIAPFVTRGTAQDYAAWEVASSALWLVYLVVGFVALLTGAATLMTGRRTVVRPVVNRASDRL